MRKENKLLIGVLTLLFVTDWTETQLSDKNPTDCDPTTYNCDKNEGNRQDLANQNVPESGQLQFYMDTAGDCNTQVRETGERSIMVYGRGAIQVGASPLTCVLSLRVDRPRDPRKYKISLLDMDIRDCNVQFYIYDGTMSQTLLGRYNCPQISDPNYEPVVYTSGNMVTFYITRSSRENTNYNVQLHVTTIRGTGEASIWAPDRVDFNRYNKFEQKYVVLIIGVLYLFVTTIVVIMLIVCAYCINRDTKSWQKTRFGYINPAMNGNGTNSTLNGSNGWATLKPLGGQSTRSQRNDSHRKAPMNVTKRMMSPGAVSDNVFESDGTLPQKRPLPSDQYDRYGPPAPRVVSERPAYRMPQPRTIARRATTDDAYIQADDDHPQSTSGERVITIPAKTKPPPEDQFTSEDEEKEEEEEEEEEGDEEVPDSSTDEEVEKASTAMNTDPDSTEQRTQDEPLSDEERGVSVTYARPQKSHQEESPPVARASQQPPRPRTPPLGDLEAYAQEPRRIGTDSQGCRHQLHQQPAAGFQPQHPRNFAPGPGGYPQEMPYSSYANDTPPRPVQPGHYPDRDYYPNMVPPSYQANNCYPRYNTSEPYYPNSYEDTVYLPRSGVERREPQGYRDSYRDPNQGLPEDPPIYSYLVQRGYNPVDMGRRSPGSSNGTNHSLENRIEETTLSANLGSGVEIMRR